MKKLSCSKAALVSALVTMFAFTAEVSATNYGGGKGHNHNHGQTCKTVTVSETKAGPANYHETYSKINQTLVTIEDYKLRLEDGSVVFVDTDPVEVNLQDLSAFSKGLRMSLVGVEFPGGAQSISVAEIEVNVRQGDNRINSTDGTSCKLSSIPGRLNFYTAAPIVLVKDAYHVKINFTALNAIQLHVLTKVTKTQCCTAKHGCKEHDRNKSCMEAVEKTEVTNQCKLVNRRNPITTIPLAIDDDF